MHNTISRWGNSLALRLPKHLLDTLGLQEGDLVSLTAENGQLVISRANNIDIGAMIAAIRPDTLPDKDFDWPAIGREIL